MTISTRFVALAALGGLLAMPAFAQAIPEEMCVVFGEASTEFAASRKDGSSEQEAMLAFAENNKESPLLALQVVPFISNFVYGLDEKQLDGDVEAAFVEQCKAYKG